MKKINSTFVQKLCTSPYTKPTVKSILCLVGIALVFVFRWNVWMPNPWMEAISAVLCVVCFVLLLLFFWRSIGEFYLIYEKNAQKKLLCKPVQQDDCVKKTREEIAALLVKNDIIDIVIWRDTTTVVIGTSSVTTGPSSPFFDRRYYITTQEDGTKEFKQEDDFFALLYRMFPSEQLLVYSIDGVRTKQKKK